MLLHPLLMCWDCRHMPSHPCFVQTSYCHVKMHQVAGAQPRSSALEGFNGRPMEALTGKSSDSGT